MNGMRAGAKVSFFLAFKRQPFLAFYWHVVQGIRQMGRCEREGLILTCQKKNNSQDIKRSWLWPA